MVDRALIESSGKEGYICQGKHLVEAKYRMDLSMSKETYAWSLVRAGVFNGK